MNGFEALAAPSPDAELVSACDALMALYEECVRRRGLPGMGFADWLAAHTREMMRLEAQVAGLPAATEIGRRAKADLVLFQLTQFVGEGSVHALSCSVLKDVLRGAE
jgi:hypothetical protein